MTTLEAMKPLAIPGIIKIVLSRTHQDPSGIYWALYELSEGKEKQEREGGEREKENEWKCADQKKKEEKVFYLLIFMVIWRKTDICKGWGRRIGIRGKGGAETLDYSTVDSSVMVAYYA